jgi:hypothetical protein
MCDLTRFDRKACFTAFARRKLMLGFDSTSLANKDEWPTTKTFFALFAALATGAKYPMGTLDMCRKKMGSNTSTLIPTA